MEVATLIMDEAEPDPDWANAAAALAVLAGISASDAACCKALGRRSRSQECRTPSDAGVVRGASGVSDTAFRAPRFATGAVVSDTFAVPVRR